MYLLSTFFLSEPHIFMTFVEKISFGVNHFTLLMNLLSTFFCSGPQLLLKSKKLRICKSDDCIFLWSDFQIRSFLLWINCWYEGFCNGRLNYFIRKNFFFACQSFWGETTKIYSFFRFHACNNNFFFLFRASIRMAKIVEPFEGSRVMYGELVWFDQ